MNEQAVEQFELPNAFGVPRTVVIVKNEHGRFSWKLIYPGIASAHTYTQSWWANIASAKRSARRFLKTLAQ